MMKKIFFLLFVLCITIVSCDPSKFPDHPVAPPGDTTIANISYSSPEACKADLFLPGGRTDTTPVIILIHGGGWKEGSRGELSFFAKAFQKKGFVVANMDYRLSPQSDDNYNMQLDDIQSLRTFLIKKAPNFIYSKTRYFIIGHSAGAHLALSFAYTRNDDHKIKAAAGMATPTNLFNMAYYNPTLYASLLTPYLGTPLTGASTDRYKAASPYYQATSASVPTILFQGDLDFIVGKDQATSMDARLQELGVDHRLIIYPLIFHDWWMNGDLVNNTVEEACNWFWNH